MPLLERKESMLLVIDTQSTFYPADRTDVDRERLDVAVERMAWLVGVAHSLGVPVVVTEEDPARNGHTDERIAAELPGGTPVFDKDHFAAPDTPEILAAIEECDRSSVVLTGLETDICVTHTAVQLQALGLRVVAVVDCLFSPGDGHEYGLQRLRDSGVELVAAKGVFYDWIRNLRELGSFHEHHARLTTPPGFHP